MPAFAYRYELRRGEEVIATGHMTSELALSVGERIMINGQPGMVRSIEPVMRERELHLIVQLLPEAKALTRRPRGPNGRPTLLASTA